MADQPEMKQMWRETQTRLKKPAVTGTFDRNAKAPVGLNYDSTPGKPGAVGVPLPVDRVMFDREPSVASPRDRGHNFEPSE